MCTDGGSDQKRGRQVIHMETVDMETFIFLDIDCLMHVFHLLVQAVLTQIDELLRKLDRHVKKYFATIASISLQLTHS